MQYIGCNFIESNNKNQYIGSVDEYVSILSIMNYKNKQLLIDLLVIFE